MVRATGHQFPGQGLPEDEILEELHALQKGDIDWRQGRCFAYVYHASDDLLDFMGRAYRVGLPTNGLSPRAFASLRQCEEDVITWMAALLGGAAAGSMTSGGSESIFLAVHTARERHRQRGGSADRRANVVVGRSAHPAFAKAAHYLGMELRRCGLRDDQRVDVQDMARMVDGDTALVVASAPSYPHGVVDDVAGVAELALSSEVLCHVDACVGGMVLPFAREIGAWDGRFDFSVGGVTSMSADLHKFGYTPKGASVVLYSSEELFELQGFSDSGWTGGTYAVPNISGTRPGGAITAAWATIRRLGRDGYGELTRQALQATARIRAGIESIPGLYVVSNPDICLLAVADDQDRIGDIASGLVDRGWALGTQGRPERGEVVTMHLTLTAGHLHSAEAFLGDLQQVVEELGTTGSAGTGTGGDLDRYN